MHDVTVSDIELAVRENFVSVEHVKRYTTTGMSADQGKTSNLNALTLLAKLTDRSIEEVGTTTFRPQSMPVPMPHRVRFTVRSRRVARLCRDRPGRGSLLMEPRITWR